MTPPRRLLGFVGLAVAAGAWELWARAESSFLVPPPSAVAERAAQEWPTSSFLSATASSLTRLGVGFVLGASIAVCLGLAMGSSPRLRRLLEPTTELLRAVPPIAIVPVAIVALGFGDAMRVAVIAFGVLFPVLVATAEGVRTVSPEARDTAALLHLGPVERAVRVYLPASMPSLVPGLRFALSVGLVMVVISEYVGEGNGLGRYILFQQSQFDIPALYAGIVFLGLLGYVLNQALVLAESRLLPGHR